jgi:hypothetical protein
MTKLPDDRRRTCVWDHETAVGSWDNVLAPHRRADGQPPTQVDISYGEATGAALAISGQIFRTTRFLETVAEHIVERYVWPARIELEMRSCGEANARWTIAERKLHICYELVREFVELSLAYGFDRPPPRPVRRSSNRSVAPTSPNRDR